MTRDELYVISKVPACLTPDTDKLCAKQTLNHHATNLKELGLDFVNLLLVHYSPLGGCKNCDPIKAQWGAMEQLLAENKTRTIGVSNYCKECIECLADAKVQPAVNQFEYHVGMGPDPEGLVSYCKSKGIVTQAYSPLGPTANHTAKDILIEGNLTTGIGKHYNKSGAQVALRWVAQVRVLSSRASPCCPRSSASASDLLCCCSLSDLLVQDADILPTASPNLLERGCVDHQGG